MQAKLKCSHCGAELTNVSFGWNAKQYLLMLPFFVIALVPMWKLFGGKHDFRAEIQVTLTDTVIEGSQIDVIGKLKNVGSHSWDHVTVEAEFLDQNGRFLNEVSSYQSISLQPGGEENFRLSTSKAGLGDNPKVVLKVSDAMEDRF